MITIYKITNRLNNKPYVGQTRQPIEKRFLQHSKANSPLGEAMRRCGLENFTIEVIETCETQAQANERECFWIKILKCTVPNGYNQRGGGSSSHVKPKAVSPTVGERIKKVRSAKKLNQTAFGKIIGLSQKAVSALEEDGGTVTERNFNIICEKFKVNPEWLRDNVGEMFMPQKKSQYLDLLIEEYGLGNEHKVLIESILELPPEVWSSVIDWIKNCASKICLQNSDFARENRRRELEAQINQARQELAEMNMEYVDNTTDSLTCEKNIFNAESETVQN